MDLTKAASTWDHFTQAAEITTFAAAKAAESLMALAPFDQEERVVVVVAAVDIASRLKPG
mgnify:CR=1 FL=1